MPVKDLCEQKDTDEIALDDPVKEVIYPKEGAVELEKRAKELADKIYETYGRDSDYLFCIPSSSVEFIIKFVLEEIEM